MDKSGDVRRVLSRYSGHNRIGSKKKLVISEFSGGGTIFTVKSRREKRSRLSLLERSSGCGGCEDEQSAEMGYSKSDSQDDELPSSNMSAKKLNPHKKIDCNGADRDSIPRKLRSVIKKRICHPISESLLDPKNLMNGTKKVCLNKPKSGLFNPEQMSKDEEEVAEALYALAGMVPRKVTSLENKSDSESPSEIQMHSKKRDNSLLSSQGLQASDEAAEETCNLTSEDLSNQKMEVDDLGKSTPFSEPNLSQTILNLNASLQVNHQSLTKTNSETKHEHVSIGSKKYGSTLLPRLHSQASHPSGADDGFPSQYSASKLPYWLHTVASSSEPGLHHSQVSQKNVSENENRSRWIKNRCATHVYISKFIQSSQKPQGKESSLVETHQLKPSEGLTFGVLNPVSNESTIMVPDSHICSSSPGKNIQDASNDTLMTLGRCSHGQQTSLAPGNSILRKRSFDFLSLSTGAGGSGKEHRVDGAQRNKIQLDPLAGLPVPHQLQPLTRYDSVASLPLPQNYIQLNAYQNLHSTSAKPPLSQLPPYFTRSNQMDSNATSITKQPQLQPHPPQQHSVWMTQPATQYTQAQIVHWQNSRQEPQIIQYTQAQTPPSYSSLSPGSHFPKYFQIPQQNHQMLRNLAPFPPNQTNSQRSTVPIWCDKSGS